MTKLDEALAADEEDRQPRSTHQSIIEALPEGTKLVVYADPYSKDEYFVASLEDRNLLEELEWSIGLEPGQEIQIFPVDIHDPVIFTVPATTEEE